MTFALRAARVFDGHAMADDTVVAIDGASIIGVGAGTAHGHVVDDLGDVTLLPGLIDCHQHLCFDGRGTLEEQVTGVPDDVLADRARDNARRALRAGVTALRDVGDRGFVTLALRGEPGLPSIKAAGPPLTPPGGHCWFLGGECDGRDALVAAVHERKRRGCDLVKLMVTGGSLTPTFPMWQTQFTDDEIRTVVDAAHAIGLPVAAHCHGTSGIVQAVDAGVDTIEHCTFFTSAGGSEPDDEVIASVAASGIPVSATIGRLPTHVAPPIIAANEARVLGAYRSLSAMGGRVVAGTDAGISPGKPHDVLPHAARELGEIGLDGTAVLAALTSTAASVCGWGDRKGRLAVGYDADLLAVAGDPTTDPEALLDVRAVWHRGERVR